MCVNVDPPKPNVNKVTKINFTEFNRNISFNFNMSLLLDKYAPYKTITVKPWAYNPWFTSNHLLKRSDRRQLE